VVSIPITVDANKTLKLTYAKLKYTLTTSVLADSTAVGIPSGATIDGQALAATMTLDPGTHTVTVPDAITVNGVTYVFASQVIA